MVLYRLLLILILGLLPLSASAINITVPQSTGFGVMLRGNANGTYTPVATSTLGLTFSTTSSNYWLTTKTTSDLIEGTNLYYLDSKARNALSALAPISYNSGTGEISCPTCGVSAGNWATSSQDYYNSQFRDWSIVGGSLRPTTTLGVLISASSTIGALTVTNGTTTNATTTNLAISSIISKILKTDTNGLIVGATAGVDYQAAGTYVTSITVSSSNGFAGSSSGGATPALTLTTSVTGVLKGNGTAISAASDGTDYTLIDALTCGSTDKFSGVTAAGVFTCSADVSGGGGGASFGEAWQLFSSKAWLAPTTTVGIIVNASSTIGNGLSGGGLTVYGGATTTGNARFDGNINFSSTGGTITSAATELVMEETGDTYGTVRLKLQNRNGVNGALFENAAVGVAKGLVDFVFKPDYDTADSQRNIRLENRIAQVFVSAPEFQLGAAANPKLVLGDSVSNFRNVDLGVGSSSPFTKLGVAGGAYIGGNLTATGTIIFTGLNCTGNTNGGALTADANGNITCSNDDSGAGGGASFGESWSFFDSKAYLAPTTSTPIIVNNATSTITNLQVVNGTTTNATSTNLNVLGNFTQGTTTPIKLFSVYGTQSGGIARFTRNAGNNPIAGLYGTQDVEVTGQGTIPTSGYGTAQTFSANGNILGSIGALTDGGLNTGRFVLNVYTNSVPAEIVTIRDLINSGVGIGTSTPVGALNISGGGTFGAWSQPLLVLSDMDAVADSKHLYASTTKGTLEFGSINDALTTRTQRLLLGNSTSTLVGNLTISGNSTTSQFAITGIGTCTAGQALKPSATAGLSCQAVTASASAGGNNQEVQYNDSTAIAGAGGFDFDKTTGRIEMAGGQSLADSFKYALHIATTTSPQFEVASSTADIFEAVSTTTSFEGGMFDGARVTVGTSTKSVQQDQLYVDGRINTGDWSYSGCEGLALNRSVAQVTDTGLSLGTVATGFGCGMWGFDEATNGQASFVSTDPAVGGYTLLAAGATGLGGATVQFDGMAMRPFNSYLSFATNTPVVSARVRISNLQHASSSITTVGFGNYTISGTAGVAGGAAGGFRYPTLGCWLTASSTQANWMAVCTNGSNATTTVNTGVATSSVFTGTPTGRFQDLRVEVSSTTAKFYIVTPNFPVASSSIPVAIIRTNIPLKTVITPIVSTTVVSPAAAGQASTLHVIRTKLWWKEPLN